VAADNYIADTENGDHLDDPSEDALFILISELNHDGNTFVTIQPDTDNSSWYASVSLLDDGAYVVEHRDPGHREHELGTRTDIDRIAHDLTIWLAARDHPGQPARTPNPDF
jgi:hypothetical protein